MPPLSPEKYQQYKRGMKKIEEDSLRDQAEWDMNRYGPSRRKQSLGSMEAHFVEARKDVLKTSLGMIKKRKK